MKIHFSDDGSDKSIPIEDIGFIILENPQITLTAPLVSELAANNTAVVFCDSHAMPTALLSVLDGNSIQQEIYRNQVYASVPQNKGLWQQIIVGKIENQARLLDKLGKDGTPLHSLARQVKSGDSDNREGVAAKMYWSLLFGKSFTRERNGDSPNNLLNYGYSVLRAATARALTGSGLFPALGIFHKNRYNAFPLADDIMEPFRPFVDEIVYYLFENGDADLSKEVKARLLEVLTCDTQYGSSLKPLTIGLASTTSSLSKYYAGEIKKLVLPKLCENV